MLFELQDLVDRDRPRRATPANAMCQAIERERGVQSSFIMAISGEL